MTVVSQSQCAISCKNYRSPFSPEGLDRGMKQSFCAAFPDGIPDEVYNNALDHRQPIDGDHGIRWESNGHPYPEYALNT